MSGVDLHLGDCLEVLRSLPDGSIGHVVTDPPYGQSNEAYDSPIAFRPEVWAECHRVTGPNAALIAFAGSPTYHRIASATEAGGWRVRQMWGWVYRDGLLSSAWPKEGFDRLRPAFDPIVYATKGKCLLSLEREGRAWARRRDPTRESSRAFGLSGRNGTRARDEATGHYPTCLLSDEGIGGFEYFVLSRTNGGKAEQTGHPNTKPLDLMRWLVSKLPESGPILDPFAGSGTTLIAAAGLGLSAIGIEIDPHYHAIARRRIDEAQAAAEAA